MSTTKPPVARSEHRRSRRTPRRTGAELAARAAKTRELRPNAYRREVLAMALAGFAVLFAVATAALGLFAAGGWLIFDVASNIRTHDASSALVDSAVGLALMIAATLVAQALWTPSHTPRGLRLRRNQAPALFAEIDAMREQIGAAPIYEVRLGNEVNASVVRRPRLGALGWHRNTLVLGLPLLLALPSTAARAVIAHELAHLSRSPREFNGWVHRLRQHWRYLADTLRGSSLPPRYLLGRFFGWYSRRFSRLTLPLAREHEFEADAAAVEITSTLDVARALSYSHARARCIEFDYWAPLYATLGQEQHPPQRAWSDLALFIVEATRDRAEMLCYARWALQMRTNAGDSHPSLTDRLAALGAPEVLPEPLDISAANEWFARHYAHVLQRFDTHWWLEHEARWRRRYKQLHRQSTPRHG